VSPLTKLFVVLLVLVSIVLTAGVVTFVNKVDPIQKNLVASRDELRLSKALLDQKNAEFAASTATLEKAVSDGANEAQAIRTQALSLRTIVEDREAQIATFKNNLAVLTSANNSQAAALAASEDAKGKLGEQVVALRKDADERLRQNADLGQRVNRLVADLERTERERRNLAEQLTSVADKADKQAKLLLDMGVTQGQIASAGTRAGAPAINGIIRSRRNIAGKEYATISIGTQDQVSRGMEFNILDQSGQFLGKLQVEVVDANEAVGQIIAEPQKIAEIKAGSVVKTQI